MIHGRLKSAQSALKLTVFFIPLGAFSLAAYLRFGTQLLPRYSWDADPYSYFGLLLLTTILWAIAAELYELTSIEKFLLASSLLRRAIKACLVTYLAVLAVTFFYRNVLFSRVFIWLSGVNLLLLTVSVQRVFGWALARRKLFQKAGCQVLIVGADQFAFRVGETLIADKVTLCSVKGYMRLPGQECVRKDLPVYDLTDIEALAIGNGIDDVIIALPPARLGDLPELRQKLSSLCAPMRLALDLGNPLESKPGVFAVGNLLMLGLESSPAESTFYVVLKRAFDLVFSGTVLILGAPVLGLIALLVRLTSPGPVFFVQERVGLNGKLFRMYKFRTMEVAPRTESDTKWTVRNDPRCTKLGRILRQTGLDELPQFFNVLKGDMSVVGPRPERPLLVQRFMKSVGNYNRRHFLKVGITGWAQVNGLRGDTSIEKRVEYDLYYVRHWTLKFDLLIVLLTFVRGFTDKNAY